MTPNILTRQLVDGVVSKLTGPPSAEVLEGNLKFRFGPGPDEPAPKTLLHDYRLWLVILFLTVTALWTICSSRSRAWSQPSARATSWRLPA